MMFSDRGETGAAFLARREGVTKPRRSLCTMQLDTQDPEVADQDSAM